MVIGADGPLKAAPIVDPGFDVAEEVDGGYGCRAGIDFEGDLTEGRREHDARKRIL